MFFTPASSSLKFSLTFINIPPLLAIFRRSARPGRFSDLKWRIAFSGVYWSSGKSRWIFGYDLLSVREIGFPVGFR